MSHDHLISLPVPVDQYIHDFYAEHPKGKLTLDHSHSVEDGRYFVTPVYDTASAMACTTLDYSNVHILHNAVDTCRQLFSGGFRLDVIQRIEFLFANDITGEPIFQDDNFMGGVEFALSRVGKGSGFRYLLNNNPLGIQIFIVSRFMAYRKRDPQAFGEVYFPVAGTHLKIQIQPRILNHSTDEQIQELFEHVANFFMMTESEDAGLVWRYHKCEFHLCVDLQGWQPDTDILSNMLCRTNALDIDGGVEKFDLKYRAVIHGKAFETITLGTASGIQICIYRKDLKVIKDGVLSYWQDIWKRDSSDNYNPDLPVWRVEVRFNSSIVHSMTPAMVNQFFTENFGLEAEKHPVNYETMEGMEVKYQGEINLCSFFQIKNYLPSFWRYGLTKIYRYVYDYAKDPETFHPIWSILLHEVDWQGRLIDLKRSYKKAVNQRDIEKTEARNVQFALSHLIALRARWLLDNFDSPKELFENLSVFVEHFLSELKGMTTFYKAFDALFYKRFGKFYQDGIFDYVLKLFRRRLLLSPAIC